MHEDIPILNFMVPVGFTHTKGKLTGVTFQKVKAEYDDKAGATWSPRASRPDHRLRRRAGRGRPGERLPWIERDCGIEFDKWNMPKVDAKTFASSHPKVFFGGDAAFGRRTSSGRCRMAMTLRCRSTS